MGYDHSLTFAVQAQINSYVEKQMAKAAALLDRQQTAEELLNFLLDFSQLSTPGFVLRRHIQAQGLVSKFVLRRQIQAQGLASKEECADLSQNRNVPWPKEVISRTAAELSSISYRRHGLAISTVNWERYLTDNISQGIQRKMIFKLAVVTNMGRSETIDLLLACAQGPYNVREPLELICWFCQRVPGLYTWRNVEELLEAWKSSALPEEAEERKECVPPDEGVTQLLRREVDELFGASLPAEQAERRLLALMTEYRAELTGPSRTAREGWLRSLEYLQALYAAGKRKKLRGLISAIYEKQGWNVGDVFQNPRGKRYVFRGELADGFGPQYEEHVFDEDAVVGEIALFCKRYYARANAIRKGTEGVDRRDILLLGYFLITGYIGADEDAAARVEELIQGGTSMDRRMELLLEALVLLRQTSNIKEKQVLCCRVLNELLAEFSFRALYVPAPFDRFFLLSLLTDCPAWTVRYLLGEQEYEV